MPHDRATRAPCDTRRVPALHPLCLVLQTTWFVEIPLVAALELQVADYEDGELRVRAPLAPNRNVHGTAFAGSLFSVCVLTGWGSTWLALKLAGLDGSIVVAESRIQYRKAVTGDIVCACRPDPGALAASLDELRSRGRTSLPLVCTIDADGKRGVTFEGSYVVHARPEK
ncbi:MAG TPA: YiiD C-terminal domain-containing protein [Gammaproteobacteria bacterium]|nr:YiiD C-terminal domain-containing protein [Gammaproteobacteria bacterium]